MWVNGHRIPADEPHLLRLGDSLQLGVPLIGTKVEFDYILTQQLLKDVKPYLAKRHKDGAKVPQIPKKFKRKLTVEDVEPSTSKPKLYRSSSAGDSFTKPCPLTPVRQLQRLSNTQPEENNPGRQIRKEEQRSDGPSSPCDLDYLWR